MRSAGGWAAVRRLRKAGIFQKSDERLLGDGDFVNRVSADAKEGMNSRYQLAARGIGIQDIIVLVADRLSMKPDDYIGPCKERRIVNGRALICYWAVRELGVSMTQVAEHLKLAVSTVSAAVKNG